MGVTTTALDFYRTLCYVIRPRPGTFKELLIKLLSVKFGLDDGNAALTMTEFSFLCRREALKEKSCPAQTEFSVKNPAHHPVPAPASR